MKKKSIIVSILFIFIIFFTPRTYAKGMDYQGSIYRDTIFKGINCTNNVTVRTGLTLTVKEGYSINLNGYNLYNYGTIICDNIDYGSGGKVYNYGSMNIEENENFFDLSLSGLDVYNATLSPYFTSTVFEYTISVDEDVNSVFVRPTLNTGFGVKNLKVNDDVIENKEQIEVPLTNEDNIIKVEVTSNDEIDSNVVNTYTITVNREQVHIHNWSEEWSYDEKGHWHECLAPQCDITDNTKMKSYHIHHTEWEVIKEATYYKTGIEQRKCTVCEQVIMTNVIPKVDLPDNFVLTIVDLADYTSKEHLVSTSSNKIFNIPTNGIYVDSNTNIIEGALTLTDDTTIYKLKEERVIGTCLSKSYTRYSGTLKDICVDTLSEDLAIHKEVRHDVYCPGDVHQTYHYIFTKYKLRVYMPTSQELEEFGLKPIAQGEDSSYPWQSTFCTLYGYSNTGGENELEYGRLYDTDLSFAYGIDGEVYDGQGATFIFDFSENFRMTTSHRDFMKYFEIIEDKKVESFIVYSDYESHVYSTEWTIDEEPTYTSNGTKSRHCTLCDDKADLEEIPMLYIEINYVALWITLSICGIWIIAITIYGIIEQNKKE